MVLIMRALTDKLSVAVLESKSWVAACPVVMAVISVMAKLKGVEIFAQNAAATYRFHQ